MKDQLQYDGFIVLRGLLPRRIIEEARQRLVALVCGSTLAADDEVISRIRRHPASHHLSFHAMGDQGFNVVFSSECVSLAAAILGSETLLNPIQHVRAKAPTAVVEAATEKPDPDVVPWHRDCYRQDHAPDALDMITFWIPLCEVDAEAGTLLIAPGSHLPNPAHRGLDAHPTVEVVAVTADQGDVVVFHKNVLHGSGRNESSRVRYSLDFRVQSSDATLGMSDVPSIPYIPIATTSRSHTMAEWRRQQYLVQRRATVT